MPRITFTDAERAAIDRITAEFDPATHPIMAPLRKHLSAEDWAFVCDRHRRDIRNHLEESLVIREFGCEPLWAAGSDWTSADTRRYAAICDAGPRSTEGEYPGEPLVSLLGLRLADAAAEALRELAVPA